MWWQRNLGEAYLTAIIWPVVAQGALLRSPGALAATTSGHTCLAADVGAAWTTKAGSMAVSDSVEEFDEIEYYRDGVEIPEGTRALLDLPAATRAAEGISPITGLRPRHLRRPAVSPWEVGGSVPFAPGREGE